MKLKIQADILDRDPPVVELDKVTASLYASETFMQVSLIGITPAQIHDAIGCPQANTYSLLVEAARQLIAAWRTSQLSSDDYDHLAEQLAALDVAPAEAPR